MRYHLESYPPITTTPYAASLRSLDTCITFFSTLHKSCYNNPRTDITPPVPPLTATARVYHQHHCFWSSLPIEPPHISDPPRPSTTLPHHPRTNQALESVTWQVDFYDTATLGSQWPNPNSNQNLHANSITPTITPANISSRPDLRHPPPLIRFLLAPVPKSITNFIICSKKVCTGVQTLLPLYVC